MCFDVDNNRTSKDDAAQMKACFFEHLKTRKALIKSTGAILTSKNAKDSNKKSTSTFI